MNKSTQNTGEQIYMVFYLFGDPLSSLHVYMIVCVYFIHIGILYIIWTIYIYIYSNIYIKVWFEVGVSCLGCPSLPNLSDLPYRGLPELCLESLFTIPLVYLAFAIDLSCIGSIIGFHASASVR